MFTINLLYLFQFLRDAIFKWGCALLGTKRNIIPNNFSGAVFECWFDFYRDPRTLKKFLKNKDIYFIRIIVAKCLFLYRTYHMLHTFI